MSIRLKTQINFNCKHCRLDWPRSPAAKEIKTINRLTRPHWLSALHEAIGHLSRWIMNNCWLIDESDRKSFSHLSVLGRHRCGARTLRLRLGAARLRHSRCADFNRFSIKNVGWLAARILITALESVWSDWEAIRKSLGISVEGESLKSRWSMLVTSPTKTSGDVIQINKRSHNDKDWCFHGTERQSRAVLDSHIRAHETSNMQIDDVCVWCRTAKGGSKQQCFVWLDGSTTSISFAFDSLALISRRLVSFSMAILASDVIRLFGSTSYLLLCDCSFHCLAFCSSLFMYR